MLGGICSLANYSVIYEETRSNWVSDFCDFMCSLFPKAILFYFYWPGDLVFDAKCLSFKPDLEIIKTVWIRSMMITSKMWPQVLIRFSFDLAWWPSFDSKQPSFKLNLEIMKTNILSQIHDNFLKNETSRMTIFSFWFGWCPSIWPQRTQFQTWLRNHQDKHFEQDSWWLLQKCTLGVLTRFSFDLALWPSFWPKLTQFWTWPRFIEAKIQSFIKIGSKLWPLECWQTNVDGQDKQRLLTTAHPEHLHR